MRSIALLLKVCLAVSLLQAQAPASRTNQRPKSVPATPKKGEKDTNATPAKNKLRLTPQLLRRLQYKYKDPFMAGFLSFSIWGLGQFYTKDYTKGSLFVFGDLVYKGLLVGLVIKLKNKYTDQVGDDTVVWRELDDFDKTLVIGYILTYLGLTFWSVYDAVESAHRYNRKYDVRSYFRLGVWPSEGRPSLYLGWHMRF